MGKGKSKLLFGIKKPANAGFLFDLNCGCVKIRL